MKRACGQRLRNSVGLATSSCNITACAVLYGFQSLLSTNLFRQTQMFQTTHKLKTVVDETKREYNIIHYSSPIVHFMRLDRTSLCFVFVLIV